MATNWKSSKVAMKAILSAVIARRSAVCVLKGSGLSGNFLLGSSIKLGLEIRINTERFMLLYAPHHFFWYLEASRNYNEKFIQGKSIKSSVKRGAVTNRNIAYCKEHKVRARSTGQGECSGCWTVTGWATEVLAVIYNPPWPQKRGSLS